MKKLCLLLLTAVLALSVIAQKEKGYVYLKNGNILKGKYRYSEDSEKLKLESAGNLWVFDVDEIDTITSFRHHRIKETQSNHSAIFYRTEIGLLAGNSDNSQSAPLSFTASGNYSLIPTFSVGAGFGVEFLKETYLPCYFNMEYKIRNSYATPYFFMKAGYQVPIEESRTVYYDVYPVYSSFYPWPDYNNENMDPKGGLLINPGLGYQRSFSANFGMSLAFGYQFHRLRYKGENDYGLDIDYNRLTIKLGITFN